MKLHIPPGMIFDKDILEETAHLLLGEIIAAQVIPKDQGTLETSHEVHHPEERRAEIAASTPYARRLYMHPEYNFRQGDAQAGSGKRGKPNKNAKGAWFEYWEPGGKYEGRAAEIYADLWNRKYGGN